MYTAAEFQKPPKISIVTMAQQPDVDEADLAYGWAEMQDQYGIYYINLSSKQTSRIKPVRASVFQRITSTTSRFR